MRFHIGRPIGKDVYLLVGASKPTAFTGGIVNIFAFDQEVEAGDILGLRTATGESECIFTSTDSGDVMRRVSSANPALGSTLSFPPPVFLATA
jgi:hypothetical protein